MENPEKPFQKIKMFDESPLTGVSSDYFNVFYPWLMFLDVLSLEETAKFMREHPLEKYTERYKEEDFTDLVNDKNREAILKLDSLVDKFNSFAQDPSLYKKEELIQMVQEANFLIRGK